MQSKIGRLFAWFLAVIYVSATIAIGIIQWREFREIRGDIKEMQEVIKEMKDDVSSIEWNIRYIELDTGRED